jgi:predicted transcriptional regulator
MNTVRLEPELKAKIQKLAQLQNITQSELHRRALELYVEQSTVVQSRFEDMFGIAEGSSELSSQVSQEFALLMAQKHD